MTKKKKLIEDLLKKILLLLKGPAYQNVIDQIKYRINSCGLITYKNFFKFSLPAEILNLSCWKYKFYDLAEKKIRSCKIYLKHEHDNDNFYHVRFNDTNRLINSNFYH